MIKKRMPQEIFKRNPSQTLSGIKSQFFKKTRKERESEREPEVPTFANQPPFAPHWTASKGKKIALHAVVVMLRKGNHHSTAFSDNSSERSKTNEGLKVKLDMNEILSKEQTQDSSPHS